MEYTSAFSLRLTSLVTCTSSGVLCERHGETNGLEGSKSADFEPTTTNGKRVARSLERERKRGLLPSFLASCLRQQRIVQVFVYSLAPTFYRKAVQRNSSIPLFTFNLGAHCSAPTPHRNAAELEKRKG